MSFEQYNSYNDCEYNLFAYKEIGHSYYHVKQFDEAFYYTDHSIKKI